MVTTIACAIVVMGCATTGQTPAADARIPEIGHLRARVERLYSAEQANDWQAWFALAGPELKTEEGSKEFWGQVSKPRGFAVRSWRIRSIRFLEGEELPANATAAVGVAMDVTVEDRGDSVRKEGDQTDYWVYMDGEWYWVWRGWPDD